MGRSVILIAGDEEAGTSDLVGGEYGYHYRKVVDRYIHSVLKYEEEVERRWVDQRLTKACREGATLVYDEFTRSRPEANNILLTVLEERMLILPTTGRESSYVKVHPDFRAVFTSNPHEYAGVHSAQDALADRMVTLDLDHYDRETEVAIASARSGMSVDGAAKVVDVVRDFRDSGDYDHVPTLRASIVIAKVAAAKGLLPLVHDPRFVRTCLDVLESKVIITSQNWTRERREKQRKMLMGFIEKRCG